MSEQSAAICCLIINGQDDSRVSEPENESEQLRRKWRAAVVSSSFGAEMEGEVKNVKPEEISQTDLSEHRPCTAVPNADELENDRALC